MESYSLRDVLGFALAALLTQLTVVRMFKMPSVGTGIPGWEMSLSLPCSAFALAERNYFTFVILETRCLRGV